RPAEILSCRRAARIVSLPPAGHCAVYMMKTRGFSVIALLALLLSQAAVAASSEAPLPRPDCSRPPGLDAILERPKLRYLLVGELHGTQETPRHFGALVGSLLTAGKRVPRGLEFNEYLHPARQRYLESSGGRQEEAVFLRDAQWGLMAAMQPDGRSSLAMLELVRRLQGWRQAGLALSVTSFQRLLRDPQPSQTPYEQSLAASLLEASAAQRPDLTVVLVGNLHARKYNDASSTPLPFVPMAMHLPAEVSLALLTVMQGGTAWTCRAGGVRGIHPVDRQPQGGTEGIALGADLAPGYDDIFGIGPVRASPPIDMADYRAELGP